MRSFGIPLLSVLFNLLCLASAAPSVPLPLSDSPPSDPISITNSSLRAPLRHSQNLTFSPWPGRFTQIPLQARFGFPDLVIVTAHSFHGTRPISLPRIRGFIQEFRDNIERESPIPGYVPRLARQSFTDIDSYTMWMIEINEGIFGFRLPSEWALLALNEISRQFGDHGPASLFFSIKEERRTYAYGFLTIQEFGVRPLAAGKSNFQRS